MFRVDRPGFCMGCGNDVGEVTVTFTAREGPPPAEVPSWCDAPACVAAQRRFDAIASEILGDDGGEAA